ncbi:MAG: TIGR02266 family protein, partial [Labilithrix sp.]|nr:TIGR02266 family protein [Labilithrix sp.]
MSQDTRKDKRAKVVSLNVRYKSATVDEFIENHSHDVSKGGIFVKTPTPFPPGTLLKFEIRLAGDKSVISGVGRVVWKREPTQAAAEKPAGMGVKFIKIDEASRAVIDKLIAQKAGAGSAYTSDPAALEDEAKTAGQPTTLRGLAAAPVASGPPVASPAAASPAASRAPAPSPAVPAAKAPPPAAPAAKAPPPAAKAPPPAPSSASSLSKTAASPRPAGPATATPSLAKTMPLGSALPNLPAPKPAAPGPPPRAGGPPPPMAHKPATAIGIGPTASPPGAAAPSGGAAPGGGASGAAAPGGVAAGGVAPAGAAPGGVASGGAAPGGAALSGTAPGAAPPPAKSSEPRLGAAPPPRPLASARKATMMGVGLPAPSSAPGAENKDSKNELPTLNAEIEPVAIEAAAASASASASAEPPAATSAGTSLAAAA